MTLIPKKGILEIEPYKGGLSKAGEGKRIIKLSSNETPLGASQKAQAVYQHAGEKLYRYPDGSATVLREAIAKVHALNAERIVCGAGSDEIISLLCNAYAGEGDEVLYSKHGFLMYAISAKAAGATPVTAPENNLRADVDALLAAVTKRTKIVFLANPNNPTGSYISKQEVIKLRKGLRDDILLVLDGAYAEYVNASDYTSGFDVVDLGENTVATFTFSKIYGLAALRVGWAYCPASVADILNRVRGPFNVSSMGIEAGAAAMLDTEFTARAKAHNDEWLPWLTSELESLGLKVYPSQGNFILVDFGSEATANAANDFLMNEGIIPRKVANYELPSCLRITIGLESDNKAVVEVLEAFLKKQRVA